MSEQVKAPKKPKVKKNGFNVPLKSGAESTQFCYYMYTMIKETNLSLLEKDDIKTAYNNFVDCCKKYDENLITWVPEGDDKYHRCITPYGVPIIPHEVQNSKYPFPFKHLPMRWKYYMPDKLQTEAEDIMNHYMVLYELIKRDVVPYMETKYWEITDKKRVEFLNSKIHKLEEEVKKYNEKLEEIQKLIYKCACEALKLQHPKLTQFD
jgi:hypothetical protein